MTDQERINRGHAARRALEEFLVPAFQTAQLAYTTRLEEIASTTPWEASKITALANAKRIVDEVHNQIKALVLDGDEAHRKLDRAKKIEELSPAKRRLLNIGSF